MEKHVLTKMHSELQTTIQSAGKTSPTAQSRMSNIQWIAKLPRRGLAYEKKERQLLIHTTGAGEKIFIQYPGKESARKGTALRPWDFRPILYLPRSKKPHEDMSFGAIWDMIFETANKFSSKNKREILRLFATLLYRMAFMLDHVKNKPFKTKQRNIQYKRNGKTYFANEKSKKLPALFKYKPNSIGLDYIAKKCPRWRNMSLEAFLFYNELLAWNEDCKYCYRNYHIDEKTEWINKKGRINTLLTYIRIIGFILGEVSPSVIFTGFYTQRGVCAASNDEVRQICGEFIKTK